MRHPVFLASPAERPKETPSDVQPEGTNSTVVAIYPIVVIVTYELPVQGCQGLPYRTRQSFPQPLPYCLSFSLELLGARFHNDSVFATPRLTVEKCETQKVERFTYTAMSPKGENARLIV